MLFSPYKHILLFDEDKLSLSESKIESKVTFDFVYYFGEPIYNEDKVVFILKHNAYVFDKSNELVEL